MNAIDFLDREEDKLENIKKENWEYSIRKNYFNEKEIVDELALYAKKVYFEKLKEKNIEFTFEEAFKLKRKFRIFGGCERFKVADYGCLSFGTIKDFRITLDRYSDKFTFKTKEKTKTLYFKIEKRYMYEDNMFRDNKTIKTIEQVKETIKNEIDNMF